MRPIIRKEMPHLKPSEAIVELCDRWQKAPENSHNMKDVEDEVEKPRKPTAFRIFADKMRPIIKEEMPNLTQTELYKELAERWLVAPENEYKKQRHGTPYQLFSNKMRYIIEAEMPDLKPTDIFKELGKRWIVAPENPKRNIKDVEHEVKKPQLPTAYRRFSDKIRPIIKEEMPDLNPTDLFIEIGKRWMISPENPNRKISVHDVEFQGDKLVEKVQEIKVDIPKVSEVKQFFLDKDAELMNIAKIIFTTTSTWDQFWDLMQPFLNTMAQLCPNVEEETKNIFDILLNKEQTITYDDFLCRAKSPDVTVKLCGVDYLVHSAVVGKIRGNELSSFNSSCGHFHIIEIFKYIYGKYKTAQELVSANTKYDLENISICMQLMNIGIFGDDKFSEKVTQFINAKNK